VEALAGMDVAFTDHPSLFRLNPNIPWKTRGNGAVCLRFKLPEGRYEEVREVAISLLEKQAEEGKRTSPGLVLLKGNIPQEVRNVTQEALREVVSVQRALRIVRGIHGEAYGLRGGRGIIGALAAVGGVLEGDHTYEAIAYRVRGNRGSPRRVDEGSVVEMDRKTKPLTYDNLDPETGRVLITPRSPDPILYGIRGENPRTLLKAMGTLKIGEPVERWTIFRTNHGTDAHLAWSYRVDELHSFLPVVVEGWVSGTPKTMVGGHVIFKLSDGSGEVDCAAYEPTGSFRATVRSFAVGDRLRVYGGIRKAYPRHPLTINLEKVEVLEVAEAFELRSPLCPKCGKRLTSMGRDKGFRCKRCGYRNSELRKVKAASSRGLKCGLYITPPRAHRHLTKPLSRYGLEKNVYAPKPPTRFWGLGGKLPSPRRRAA